jgi:NodT family efflux transporter outer membrane factor (OMF) lipoprotein
MKSSTAIALSGLCVALASCTQDITPHVTAIKDRELGLSNESAPAVAPDWWKALDDPELDRLVVLALKDSPTLEQVRARLRAAQSEVESARSAEFPHLSFDAIEERDQLSGKFIIPPPYGGTWQWIGAFGGVLSWDIDLWGREAALVGKARALGGAAQLDINAAALALEGALVNAYIGLNEAYKLADVADETVTERTHILDLSARREKDGIDSRAELLQAQTLLDSAREDAERAHGNCDVAIHAVVALTGQGANAYPTVGRPALSRNLVIPLPQTLPADLLARRPDIGAAKLRIEAAMEGREAAHAAFYPDVNLLGAFGFAALGLGNLFTTQAAQYGGGAALHLPIFDAGKLRSDYESATADLDASVADYNASVIAAVRDAADRLTQIRSLDAQGVEQTRFIHDAQDGYNLAETRYRTGLANQLTVFNAEDLLLQAREQQAEIDAGRASERINLILAVGGGFDQPLTGLKTANAEKSP